MYMCVLIKLINKLLVGSPPWAHPSFSIMHYYCVYANKMQDLISGRELEFWDFFIM